jgi:hypothetical protein
LSFHFSASCPLRISPSWSGRGRARKEVSALVPRPAVRAVKTHGKPSHFPNRDFAHMSHTNLPVTLSKYSCSARAGFLRQ